MDAKTSQKIINGMAEEIDSLEVKIQDRVKFAQIQDEKIHKLEKRNKVLEEITDIHANQIHCICEGITSENNKINNKIKNIILMESETMEIESSFMDRLDSLEEKIKKCDKNLTNHTNYQVNKLNDKIDDLEAKNYQLKSEFDKFRKYDFNNKDIEYLIDKVEGLTNVADNNTGCIASISDDLNDLDINATISFQKRAEIIISRLVDKNDDLKKYILNMPIESIIDRLYTLEQNDFNNVMGQAHETLKRVKNNKTEGK